MTKNFMVTICCKSISTPLKRHNFLQNQLFLKIKKTSETRVQELSSATKHVFVAQTVQKWEQNENEVSKSK